MQNNTFTPQEGAQVCICWLVKQIITRLVIVNTVVFLVFFLEQMGSVYTGDSEDIATVQYAGACVIWTLILFCQCELWLLGCNRFSWNSLSVFMVHVENKHFRVWMTHGLLTITHSNILLCLQYMYFSVWLKYRDDRQLFNFLTTFSWY